MTDSEIRSFEHDEIREIGGTLPPVDPNQAYSSETQAIGEVRFREVGLESDFKQASTFIYELRNKFSHSIAVDKNFDRAVVELKSQLVSLSNLTKTDLEIKKTGWKIIRNWLRAQVTVLGRQITKDIPTDMLSNQQILQISKKIPQLQTLVPVEEKKMIEFSKIKKFFSNIALMQSLSKKTTY